MKYLIMIYGAETAWSEQERADCMQESTALCHELNAAGVFLDAAPLYPVASATSIRLREGKRLITDGPFAETAEQLGGYYLVNVDNLDQAIAIASRIPGLRKGTIEIRPVVELPNMPMVAG